MMHRTLALLTLATALPACTSTLDLGVFDVAADDHGGADADADADADTDADAEPDGDDTPDGDAEPDGDADVPPPVLGDVVSPGRGVTPVYLEFADRILIAYAADPTDPVVERRDRFLFALADWDLADVEEKAYFDLSDQGHPDDLAADARPLAYASCGVAGDHAAALFWYAVEGLSDLVPILVTTDDGGVTLSAAPASDLVDAFGTAPRLAHAAPDGTAGCVTAWIEDEDQTGPLPAVIRAARLESDGSLAWLVATAMTEADGWVFEATTGGPTLKGWPVVVSDGAGGAVVAVAGVHAGESRAALVGQRFDASGAALWDAGTHPHGGKELQRWPRTTIGSWPLTEPHDTLIRRGSSFHLAVVGQEPAAAGGDRCAYVTSVSMAGASGPVPGAVAGCAQSHTYSVTLADAPTSPLAVVFDFDETDFDPSSFYVHHLVVGGLDPLDHWGGLPKTAVDGHGDLLVVWLFSGTTTVGEWGLHLLRVAASPDGDLPPAPAPGWPMERTPPGNPRDGVRLRESTPPMTGEPTVVGRPLPAPGPRFGAVVGWSEANPSDPDRSDLKLVRVYDDDP